MKQVKRSPAKSQRVLIAGALLITIVVASAGWVLTRQQAPTGPRVVVYKSPRCGCCGKWVDHLRSNGFEVEVVNRGNLDSLKRHYGVPSKLGSCHTATVGKYVIEGHVPADAIRRLLAVRPQIRGLAVPGMPTGSPGMEGPDPVAYEVLQFQADGRQAPFEREQGRRNRQ